MHFWVLLGLQCRFQAFQRSVLARRHGNRLQMASRARCMMAPPPSRNSQKLDSKKTGSRTGACRRYVSTLVGKQSLDTWLVRQWQGRHKCAIERVTSAKQAVQVSNGSGHVLLRNIGIETGATTKHPAHVGRRSQKAHSISRGLHENMPPMSVTFATFQLKRSVLKVVQFQNISSKSVAFAAFHLERSASNLMITYVDAAPANAIAAVASAVVLSRSQQNFWQQQQLTADDDGG
jgi:hypothetical protein